MKYTVYSLSGAFVYYVIKFTYPNIYSFYYKRWTKSLESKNTLCLRFNNGAKSRIQNKWRKNKRPSQTFFFKLTVIIFFDILKQIEILLRMISNHLLGNRRYNHIFKWILVTLEINFRYRQSYNFLGNGKIQYYFYNKFKLA